MLSLSGSVSCPPASIRIQSFKIQVLFVQFSRGVPCVSRDRLLPLSQISARSSLSPTLSLCVSFSLPLLHTRKKPLLQPPCLPYFPPFSTGLHRQETFNSHIPFSNHPGPFFHRQPLWRWSRVLHDWGHAYAGCNCVVVSCPRVDIIVPARIETLSSPPFFVLHVLAVYIISHPRVMLGLTL